MSDGVKKATAELVIERDSGQCVARALHPGQARPGQQIHHRKPRRMGGTVDPDTNSACNLIFLCSPCHDHIESHRTIAYDNGWLLSAQSDPARTPLLYMGRLVYLTHDGETPQFLSTPWSPGA